MTRIDELTLRLLDGLLTDEEGRELDRLVQEDPRAEESALRLLETEAGLRADRRSLDAAPEVLARIRRTGTGRTEEKVMEAIQAGPAPAWRKRPRPWIATAPPLAAAALLLTAAGFFLLRGDENLARIESEGREAVLVRDGRESIALHGQALRAGDTVRAGAEGVVLRFEGDSTELLLAPGTELTFGGDGRAKRIVLHEGEIEADVSPQEEPLRIEASHAVAEVLGTKLKLSASPDATRLEVSEGRVRLTRDSDGSTVEVPARHFSVAEPDGKLVAEPVVPAGPRPPRVVSFSLIEADTPRAPFPGFEELKDGAVVNLAKLPTRRINLRANTDPPVVGSVRFSIAGDENANTELVKPYTIIPNGGRGKRTWRPGEGIHTVTATPYTGSYGNGVRGEPLTITLTLVNDRESAAETADRPVVAGFSLIAADAPRDPIPGYENLGDEVTIRLADLPTRRINLRATTEPRNVGSVRFSLPTDSNFNTEERWPYVIVASRAWKPGPGTHVVTATPYTDAYGNGLRGSPKTIRITIIRDR